jgi:hypothetical protein
MREIIFGRNLSPRERAGAERVDVRHAFDCLNSKNNNSRAGSALSLQPFGAGKFESCVSPHGGIPAGFCLKAQGCESDELPWVHVRRMEQPQRGCVRP